MRRRCARGRAARAARGAYSTAHAVHAGRRDVRASPPRPRPPGAAPPLDVPRLCDGIAALLLGEAWEGKLGALMAAKARGRPGGGEGGGAAECMGRRAALRAGKRSHLGGESPQRRPASPAHTYTHSCRAAAGRALRGPAGRV